MTTDFVSSDSEHGDTVAARLRKASSSVVPFLVSELINLGGAISTLFTDYAERHGILDTIDLAVDKLYEHPILGWALLACGIVCSVPVLFFLSTAFFSIIFTTIGFLIVEGIFLTVSFLFFVPCFIIVVLLMILVALGLISAYIAALTATRYLKRKHKLGLTQSEEEESDE